MNLECNPAVGDGKKSGLQRTRVITEEWFGREFYCLKCDSNRLDATTASTIARDFVCPVCAEPYELKSAAKAHTDLVQDGGYYAMMGRLYLRESPTLMLLHYSPGWRVQGLVAVSSVFLTPEVVRRRQNPHLRRSGVSYQMCDIDLSLIPPDGKIVVVAGSKVRPAQQARAAFRASAGFEAIPMDKRGWVALVLKAVRDAGKSIFTNADIYAFADKMHEVYPGNSHIEPKIRQKLQDLEALGYIERIEKGVYRVLQ